MLATPDDRDRPTLDVTEFAQVEGGASAIAVDAGRNSIYPALLALVETGHVQAETATAPACTRSAGKANASPRRSARAPSGHR